MTTPGASSRAYLPRAFQFRRHFAAYVAALALGVLLNVGFGVGLPFFWPFAAWAFALAIHFFIASSFDVNDQWVDERAAELRMRSYDFDHIANIRDRVANREDTLIHPVERDPKP